MTPSERDGIMELSWKIANPDFPGGPFYWDDVEFYWLYNWDSRNEIIWC